MADGGKTFQAKIELMGKLHGSLSGAVRMAQGKLNQLANTARKMGAAIGRGFAKVGSVLKSFAGQVIGLTLAFAGLRSAGEFIAKAKEQFRGNEQAAAELNATLANNPKIMKLGNKEIERQQKLMSDLADRMQEQSTYASSVWRSAFTGLAQWGAGAKDAEKLSGFINDILAGRHGLKATAANAKSLGDALGKMVATGKLGKFGKEFGLGKDDEKRLAKMKTAAERIDYIQRRATKYRGRAEALGATEAGEIQKAENRIADFQSRMGEGFVRTEGKWIKFVDRMVPYLEPVIKKVTELFEDALVGFTDWMDDFLADEEVIKSWNELAKAGGDLWNVISGIAGLGDDIEFGKWLKAEFINQIRMLKEDLELILKAIKRINELWGKFTAPLPPETQKRMDLMTAPAGGGTMGTRAAEQAQAQAVAAGQIEAPRRRLIGQAAHRAAQAEAIAARAAAQQPIAVPAEVPAMAEELSNVQQEVAAITESAGEATAKVAAIEEPTAKVEEAAKEAGKAFQGWDIGGAIKSGLGWIGNKLTEITQKAGQANAALSSGGAPAAPATPMQHGGIVDRPTFASLAEAGPEAVIPLTGSGRRSTDLLGAAAAALGVHGGSRFNVSYAPSFVVNGAGPEAARTIERIVRAGHEELLGQIEAIDSEMMRRAFV